MYPNQQSTWHTTAPSPLGELTLVRDGEGLRGLYFPHHWYLPDRRSFGPQRHDGFEGVIAQLGEYFGGTRRVFDQPLTPHGDEFQLAVWQHVARLGYGQTATYGDLAARIGGAATAQQVGAAVGRNPLSIIVPCHRVVGRGGKLTGYAGGIARKRQLLDLEAANPVSGDDTAVQQTLLPPLW